MVRRHALAHDPAGDRGELVIDVGDSLGIDFRPDALDLIGAAIGRQEPFEVGRHGGPPNTSVRLARRRPPWSAPGAAPQVAWSGAGASSRFTDSKPCIMTRYKALVRSDLGAPAGRPDAGKEGLQ